MFGEITSFLTEMDIGGCAMGPLGWLSNTHFRMEDGFNSLTSRRQCYLSVDFLYTFHLFSYHSPQTQKLPIGLRTLE
jgi:hypothetical protein